MIYYIPKILYLELIKNDATVLFIRNFLYICILSVSTNLNLN